MVGSHMHQRFGLFGTDRTEAGITKMRTIRPFSPVAGFGGTRSGDLGKVEAGVCSCRVVKPHRVVFRVVCGVGRGFGF